MHSNRDAMWLAYIIWSICMGISLCNTRKIRKYFQKENEILSRYPGQDDYISPTTHVVAVAGGIATLSCDVTSLTPDDSAVLVLWYKNGVVKPIYSYDSRHGAAKHWKNAVQIGSRATYDPKRGQLFIQKITPEDKGSYRCRVHFKTNPTLSYGTNLTIIIPPSRIVIVDPAGGEAGSSVGPFQEGDHLRLRCEAMGGNPTPEVSWWEGPRLLDKQDEITTPHQVANILVLEELTRADLNRVLTCTASNTNLSAPLTTSVTIEMNFSPKSVSILSSRDPLIAGRSYEITCQSKGSRPPAKIKWHIKTSTLSSFSNQATEDGNVTTSTLQFSPQIEDNGKGLQCIGTSPALPRFPVIDTWNLNVYFPPEAKIRAGSSLNLQRIEENDDVYFECEIKANPAVYKIVWYHQGVELRHNVSQGIIISNQSLVLQKVRKSATGLYSCKASNIEGDGASGTLELTVKFAPVCDPHQMLFHGAAPNEKVDIPCLVEAHPPPDNFKWTFNNSGESVDIADDRVHKDGFEATVSYTPRTELDYGTLLCRATNAVGVQSQPCIFHVFPAGRPDPVHNCTQFNFSESSIHIRCHPGFDGGLPQSFNFQIFNKKRLISNQTNKVAVLTLNDVSSTTIYDVVIRSLNNKGTSDAFTIKTYTLKDNAEKRTAAIKPAPSGSGGGDPLLPLLTPILAITLGVAIGMVSVIIVVVSVVRFRRRREPANDKTQASEGSVKPPKGGLLDAQSDPQDADRRKATSTQVLLQKASPQSSENEEGGSNPDLIPNKSGKGAFWNQCIEPSITPNKLSKSNPRHSPFGVDRSVPSRHQYLESQPTSLNPERRGSLQNIYESGASLDKRLMAPTDTLPRRITKGKIEPQDPSVWYGTQFMGDETSVSDSYRSSPASGGIPWGGHSGYQAKLRLGNELETIEPLLNSQRESSV